MLLAPESNTHLTYCLNVHSGESWAENLAAITNHAAAVKEQVCPDSPFGLGLRLSNEASLTLTDPNKLAEFRRILSERGMYVFTMNGFPYGAFHKTRVKEKVYQPDWRTGERVAYTKRLADIMSELLPAGMCGSISTVPGSYGAWIESDADRHLMAENIGETARYLAELHDRTGRLIHIGLEPEPDCFLEKTADVISFFEDYLYRLPERDLVRRHVGVCFDTCHMALQFENLTDSLELLCEKDILISKIQLSSALRTDSDAGLKGRLSPFCDEVYLHQVKVRLESGELVSINDLPEALERSAELTGEWRVHFHVPLYFSGLGGLRSTSKLMDGTFFMTALKYGVEHMEIETYTFDVLPPDLKERGVNASIVSEYEWLINCFAASGLYSRDDVSC